MENRDLQADLNILDLGGRSEDDFVYGVVAPHAIERAIEAEKQLAAEKEKSAHWICKHTAAEQNYQTQSNLIAELREQVNRADKAFREIIEYSKHDGISKHLDNCYVTARHAISTLYPLDREEDKKKIPINKNRD